jgi:hypothetical protein
MPNDHATDDLWTWEDAKAGRCSVLLVATPRDPRIKKWWPQPKAPTAAPPPPQRAVLTLAASTSASASELRSAVQREAIAATVEAVALLRDVMTDPKTDPSTKLRAAGVVTRFGHANAAAEVTLRMDDRPAEQMTRTEIRAAVEALLRPPPALIDVTPTATRTTTDREGSPDHE